MINIKAKNKIVAGKYQEYQFRIKAGRLYLRCLENEISVDRSTIYSINEISYSESPKVSSMVARGYLGNYILGTIGMIAGVSSAKRHGIHRLQIQFANGEMGIAEVDDNIFNRLLVL